MGRSLRRYDPPFRLRPGDPASLGYDPCSGDAAAGDVGTFAVQIARTLGATVVGTASERNHEYLHNHEVTPVSYGPGLEERLLSIAPNGFDAALDCIGGEALDLSTRVVVRRERIGTTTDRMGASRWGVRMISTDRSQDSRGKLVSMHSAETLRVEIASAHRLSEADEEHREVATARASFTALRSPVRPPIKSGRSLVPPSRRIFRRRWTPCSLGPPRDPPSRGPGRESRLPTLACHPAMAARHHRCAVAS